MLTARNDQLEGGRLGAEQGDDLDAGGSAALVTSGNDVKDETTGSPSYDRTGGGRHDVVAFAGLTTKPRDLSAIDFIVAA